MKYILQTIIFILITIIITGCYNAKGDIKLNKDGTGNLALSVNIKKDYYSSNTLKSSFESKIQENKLTHDVTINNYSETVNKDKGEFEIKSDISFKNIDQLKYLGLGVNIEKIANASMSQNEKVKYPTNAYKLKIQAEDQSATGGSIALTIHPSEKIIDSNGVIKGNIVSYTFMGKTSQDNYIIVKPTTINIFDIIFI